MWLISPQFEHVIHSSVLFSSSNLLVEIIVLLLELILGLKFELIFLLKPILLKLLNLCYITLFAQLLIVLGIFL